MTTSCPICLMRSAELESTVRDAEFIHCSNCGNFELARTAKVIIDRIDQADVARSSLSHHIRLIQNNNDRPIITSDFVGRVTKEKQLPSPAIQVEYLILWVGNNSITPGTDIELSDATHRALIGAASENGFNFILSYVITENFIERILYAGKSQYFRLTFSGWNLYETIRRGRAEGNKAFMAMQFDDPELDRVVQEHFVPAVKQTGFDLKRVSDNKKAGLIDDKIRIEILTSKFLIADLTHGNQGAYWEAGYAEGLGKPVIYTCRSDKFNALHFDANHHLTVKWDTSDLLSACENLKATIRATLPEYAILSD